MLAVVYFLKQLHHYLWGRKFVVRTDHAALRWLWKTPQPMAQQARWLEQLSAYDFEIMHRPGAKHGNADALSRKPQDLIKEEPQLDQPVEDSTEKETVTVCQLAAQQAVLIRVKRHPVVELEEFDGLADLQREDPELQDLYQFKTESEERPSAEAVSACSDLTKAYVAQWSNIQLRNGILKRGSRE
mgnify:FL=1